MYNLFEDINVKQTVYVNKFIIKTSLLKLFV